MGRGLRATGMDEPRRRVRLALTLTLVFMAVAGLLALDLPPRRSGPPAAEAHHAPVEGFGAVTRGGEGRPECVVRSLGDSGPHTLRECLSAGHRSVTFAVAGLIVLTSQLDVQGAHVTIDGFTAPWPGITLSGAGLNISDTGGEVHDVIVRGLRIRDAGRLSGGHRSGGKSSTDCVGLYGAGVFNVVIDHVSIHNCADGGIDISSGPKNVTIQWSIVSTGKAMLWGSTSSSAARDTTRISLHHSVVMCDDEAHGCDRFPLIRASHRVLVADLRQNVFGRWLRASGTRIEPAASVNVVGNAYIPRADATFAQRQQSLGVEPSTRVYTAANVELGPPPRPDLNENGNTRRPLPAPAITQRPLGCVVRQAGMHPRDAVDERLTAYAAAVLTACNETSTGFPPSPGRSDR
jgi:hypothetical protein